MRTAGSDSSVFLIVADTGTGMPHGRARARVRAVLHDQGGRQGDGPRAVDRLRDRQAVGGGHPGAERGRTRAPCSRSRCRWRARRVRRRRTPPTTCPRGARRSCWSRTTSRCASWSSRCCSRLGYDVLVAADGGGAIDLCQRTSGKDLAADHRHRHAAGVRARRCTRGCRRWCRTSPSSTCPAIPATSVLARGRARRGGGVSPEAVHADGAGAQGARSPGRGARGAAARAEVVCYTLRAL